MPARQRSLLRGVAGALLALLVVACGAGIVWFQQGRAEARLALEQPAQPLPAPPESPTGAAEVHRCGAQDGPWCREAQLWWSGGAPLTLSRSECAVVPCRPHQTLPPSSAQDRVTVLVLGLDERSEEDRIWRTDVMLLLTLDRAHHRAGMLSIPRDLWVPIPGFANDRINTAYGLGEQHGYPGGGPALAVATVEYNLGVPIDYYVLLNFEGFVQGIDLIGGIDVDVPMVIDDPNYLEPDGVTLTPLHIDAGMQHFDGDTALRYVRTRYVRGGDISRTQRQQQVVMAVLDKITRLNLLPDLLRRSPELTAAFEATVQTDMPLSKLVSLASEAAQVDRGTVRARVLDQNCVEPWTTPTGGQVLLPVWPEILAARDAVFGGE